MHICKNCGHKFEGNFCPECGAGVNQSKTCPECGATLADNAKFCNLCGYSFAESAPVKGGNEAQTVQDNPNSLDNLYVLARRALESKDYTKTEMYYSQILLADPNDWEATFYSALADARVYAGKYPDGAPARLCKGVTHVYELIKRAFTDKRTQCEKLNEVISGLNLFINDYYDNISLAVYRHINRRSIGIRNLLWECGDNIAKNFGNDEEFNQLAVASWKHGINVALDILNYLRENPAESSRMPVADNYENQTIKIKKYAEKIKQKNPSYIPPQIKPAKRGCYVATCVYGSYDCAEVWTLRRYRDYTLAATRSGRAFIRLYYAISPTIVKLFGKQKWFHKLFKKKLDKKVKRLQKRGVASTPYIDKDRQ